MSANNCSKKYLRVQLLGLRRNRSPDANPPELPAVSGFSRELLAKSLFGRLPINELAFPLLKIPETLVEDFLVPGRRFNGLRGSDKVLPQRLHRIELFLEGHILEWKMERHGSSIPNP